MLLFEFIGLSSSTETMLEKTESVVSLEDFSKVKSKLDLLLSPNGFECHPFKVGWYNDHVAESFHLEYQPDTLAFVIISIPSMFEKTFIPYLLEADCLRPQGDPLDQCMVKHFSGIKEEFPSYDISTIHDFELTANRRPRILVQTAGHVSGAVRYYQRKDVKSDPWDEKKKIFGVCLHPRYGGWFALRGVLIFSGVTCPDLPRQPSSDILKTDDEIIELLRRYNEHWEDWSFRDIIPVEERYSKNQMDYFSTKPSERMDIIDSLRNLAKN